MFSCEIRKVFKNTFLRNTSGGCFYYDSKTYDMVELRLLILVSFQFKQGKPLALSLCDLTAKILLK